MGSLVRLGVSCAVVVVCAVGNRAADAGPVSIHLVSDGKPAATIVVAKAPTRAAQLAAAELQYHVHKITGARLPIATDEKPVSGTRVLVGQSKGTAALGLANSDFKPQEYLIRFQPGVLVLMGRDKMSPDKPGSKPFDYHNGRTFPDVFDQQGTCYAAYDFLERFCNVRWYLPTELGIVCPSTKTLVVTGTQVRRRPAMHYRFVHYAYQYPADLCGDTIRGKKPTPALPWRDQMLFIHRHRIGGKPMAVNHSLYGYYARFWKDPDAKKPSKHFESYHPEYFAQGYPGKPTQMCYTNPGLARQVVEDARDYFDGKGKKIGAQALGDSFAVVPMDNSAYCKCPTCKPLVDPKREPTRGKGHFSNDWASNYVFMFVNRIARGINTSHPDHWIAAIAYSKYCYPPTREPLEPNVWVKMCLHARMVYNPEVQANDMDVLKAWHAESKTRPKYLWLYYCFPSLNAKSQQFRCFPGFFAHHIVRQMKTYYAHGVRGISYEPAYLAGSRRSPLQNQLEFYVTWKLADDPTQDGHKLIDEFFKRYYGAAAKPMKAFYELVEKTYCDPASYPPKAGHQTEQIAWKHLGTPERMAKLGQYMAEARAAARTELEKKRVALFDKGIWQYMQAGRRQYQKRQAMMAPTMQKTRVPRLTGSSPGGDPKQVSWSGAGVLGGWRQLTGEPTERKIEGRVAHDGTHLYVRLEEHLDTAKLLRTGGSVWNEDEYEIFVGGQRGRPYRQMGVNADGVHIDLEHTVKRKMIKWASGARVVSDTGAPDRWTLFIAFPLAKLVPGGVRPGQTIYLNVLRSTRMKNALAWIPTFAGFHAPQRFGEVVLAK